MILININKIQTSAGKDFSLKKDHWRQEKKEKGESKKGWICIIEADRAGLDTEFAHCAVLIMCCQVYGVYNDW